MVRARNSVRAVRQNLRRMIEEDPEPAVRSNLMARMAAANAETEDALVEIETIAKRSVK
jgi:hypothetical protein